MPKTIIADISYLIILTNIGELQLGRGGDGRRPADHMLKKPNTFLTFDL